MFSDECTIGEARVSNLSVSGCTLDCEGNLPEETTLHLRLILPDDRESLPIDGAEVRWVKGKCLGSNSDDWSAKPTFACMALCGIGCSNASR